MLVSFHFHSVCKMHNNKAEMLAWELYLKSLFWHTLFVLSRMIHLGKKKSQQTGVFPKQDHKRLSGSFSNVWARCHCLSSQIEKNKWPPTLDTLLNSLHTNPAVSSRLLICFITGSCQGRALSTGRRAACRIPTEWVHAGLACAEMPWISTVLRFSMQAKACSSSISSFSLASCFRTLQRVCMLRRGAVLRYRSHGGGADGTGPVCDCWASWHAVRASQQFL